MNDHEHTLETRAAELGGEDLEWNELDFVGWKEFRRMAPAVVRLEIARLERAALELKPPDDAYNAIVRARYELKRFADGLGTASKDDLDDRADHLRRALLAVSMVAAESDAVRYAVRRLQYVHDRLKLIY